jgi:hypothetical protein
MACASAGSVEAVLLSCNCRRPYGRQILRRRGAMTTNRARGWRRTTHRCRAVGDLVVGFGGYLWVSEVNRIGEYFRLGLDQCNFAFNADTNVLLQTTKQEERQQMEAANWSRYKECSERASRFNRQKQSDLWNGLPVLVALDAGAVGFGWLVVWLVILVVRWVQRGFAASPG